MSVSVFCVFSLAVCSGGEILPPDLSDKTTEVLTAPSTYPGGNYPPEVEYSVSSVGVPSNPRYLQTVNDSGYNTKITRVTDRVANDDFGRHPYPVHGTPWNADGTVYQLGTRLYRSSDNKEIITAGLDNDAAWYKTGETTGGYSGASVRWSHTNPNIMYSVMDNTNGLLKLTMNASRTNISQKMIIDLSGRGYVYLSVGNGEGIISNDGKFILLVGDKGNGQLDLILVNLKTETEVWTKESKEADTSNLDYISVDASGRFIVGKINDRSHVYDINLNNHYVMLGNNSEGSEESFIGHSNFGIDTNGNPVIVSMTHNKSTISMFNLVTKVKTELLSDNHGGGHISTGNYKRPGWAYVSTEGWNGRGRDVFAIKLDPNKLPNKAKVQFFAHTHNTNPSNDYDYQTHIGVNPLGDVVLFRSKWGSGTGDSYISRAK